MRRAPPSSPRFSGTDACGAAHFAAAARATQVEVVPAVAALSIPNSALVTLVRTMISNLAGAPHS
jgi:hypothetical protein